MRCPGGSRTGDDEDELMAEFIVSGIIFICICIPLVIILAKTFMGKIKVSKAELVISVVIAVVFTFFVVYRLASGRGMKAMSGFDVYFILQAIANVVARYKRGGAYYGSKNSKCYSMYSTKYKRTGGNNSGKTWHSGIRIY